ncbi:uncharacterized protein LOC132259410 isoform X2 [Phlebotomus argentipes]|uniref:uncharacterized protein LOC132259410 isoform X2 n=1 Tax=Phlebotomus argentipes TaxID=94469 RepID=UPI0028930EDF|nr:uncharacterized protein LOC132259410 isoform X2 [Phlebotomus argentipes]
MPTRNDVETEQQLYGLPLLLHTLVIRLAATLLGQFLLHLSDRVLWTVENLTYWSIPPQRLAEFANAPQTPLVRPLSWWLFLPGLLCLRFIRKSCSVALWFVGIEPVTPVSMVCYVQVQRKKIQSIKQAGAKVIRKRREESAKRPGLIRAIWYKLQQICCLEYIFTENGEVKVLEPKNPEASESEESSEEETELTFAELLEKYASMECEENDPDYMPEEEESSESSEESGGDEGDMMFGEDDDTRKVLNRSFVCEPRQTYTRGDTPPLKGFSNSLHPGNIPHQDTTVHNGTPVDRRKGSVQKKNNQKYRGGGTNRMNIKQNNYVRKNPVITVSDTNNAGGNFFNTIDGSETLLQLRRFLELVAHQKPLHPKK